MKVRFLVDEDVVNYKITSMFIGFPYCTFKCNTGSGREICQNQCLLSTPTIEISIDDICKRYLDNELSHAIVLGGFEPFDSPFDLETLIDTFRNKYECYDDIIIYSGYDKEELTGKKELDLPEVNQELLVAVYRQITQYKNIIIKYGRYIPNQKPHRDDILGVDLASDNQYAEKII